MLVLRYLCESLCFSVSPGSDLPDIQRKQELFGILQPVGARLGLVFLAQEQSDCSLGGVKRLGADPVPPPPQGTSGAEEALGPHPKRPL